MWIQMCSIHHIIFVAVQGYMSIETKSGFRCRHSQQATCFKYGIFLLQIAFYKQDFDSCFQFQNKVDANCKDTDVYFKDNLKV